MFLTQIPMRRRPPNIRSLSYLCNGRPQPTTTFHPHRSDPPSRHHLEYLWTQPETHQTRYVGQYWAWCQALPEQSPQLPRFFLRHSVLEASHVHTQSHSSRQVAILDQHMPGLACEQSSSTTAHYPWVTRGFCSRVWWPEHRHQCSALDWHNVPGTKDSRTVQ